MCPEHSSKPAVLLAVSIFAFLLVTTAFSAVGTAATLDQPTLWASNPNVAAFERMENDRLAAAQRSIDKILAVKGPRTLENTLAPYDAAVAQLNAAGAFAGLMQEVHPEAAFRDHATTMTVKVSAASTALSLNRDIYHALAALDVTSSDPATRYYVQRQLLEYRLAGVDKDDATRARIKQLQEKLTELVSAFDRNISDDQRSITVDSAVQLDGLPKDYIESHKPGPDGKIVISTNYPDAFPVFNFAQSEDLRRRLFIAFESRAYPKNRDVLLDILKTRFELATILGYSNWADFNAADQMIRSGKNIASFIQQVDAASRPEAQREFAMILAEKQKLHPESKQVFDFEGHYLVELVRRSNYDFDSSSVRPYFPYDRVKQGVLDVAAKLFQLSFRQERNAPAWHPSVETWDVFSSGKMIGRFYLDMHPRDGKFSHAEMDQVLPGIRGKQLPEATLVCNFPAPTASDPGLMEYSDVVTFLHEFGHLMHWILAGDQQWAGISGITMESDFAEAPSQMLEEWMRSPQVLATFAHQYKTNEPIPADLVQRMNRASAFGRGGWVIGQLEYTAMSYEFYNRDPKQVDFDAISADLDHRYSLYAVTPDIHDWASFGHLGGYSSAYYTYLYDKVIAEDFMTQFNRADLFAQTPADRYRRIVLEPGGSMSANDLVKNFLGRPQSMEAIQQWIKEEFASGASN